MVSINAGQPGNNRLKAVEKLTIMKKITVIIILGYLTNQEVAHGKTALWVDGRIEVVTNFNAEDYSYADHQIPTEVEKANSYLWQLAQKEGYVVIPVAAAEEIENIVQ